jgi:hypothetical protein
MNLLLILNHQSSLAFLLKKINSINIVQNLFYQKELQMLENLIKVSQVIAFY